MNMSVGFAMVIGTWPFCASHAHHMCALHARHVSLCFSPRHGDAGGVANGCQKPFRRQHRTRRKEPKRYTASFTFTIKRGFGEGRGDPETERKVKQRRRNGMRQTSPHLLGISCR
ncbi:uncharacterized protein B0T15DRAFT_97213 [Chaetomium strumarium]|uniref:Uncharacterized protein n=1 Tax=Chaetomium strumarium TaxID=1170767 RepID=A0AAJ0M3X3_9PEZI|nr:hypothetical protein B0T15DRAFT_97213 [Chaetomium strumarium]